jgi:hypothetical protein
MPPRCGQRGPDRGGFLPPSDSAALRGYETSLRTLTEVAEALGSDPDARVAGGGDPAVAVRVEGGVRIEDVFVPDHRLLSMSAVTDGTWPVATDEPIYRTPFVPVATVLLLGPLLGAGHAALDLVIEKAPRKGMHHTFFATQ